MVHRWSPSGLCYDYDDDDYYYQHKAAGMKIRLNKNSDHDEVSHGANVARKVTTFPLWIAIDKHWNGNTVSVVSSMTAVMRLPISWISSMANWFQVLAVSTATERQRARHTLQSCSLLPCLQLSMLLWQSDLCATQHMCQELWRPMPLLLLLLLHSAHRCSRFLLVTVKLDISNKNFTLLW